MGTSFSRLCCCAAQEKCSGPSDKNIHYTKNQLDASSDSNGVTGFSESDYPSPVAAQRHQASHNQDSLHARINVPAMVINSCDVVSPFSLSAFYPPMIFGADLVAAKQSAVCPMRLPVLTLQGAASEDEVVFMSVCSPHGSELLRRKEQQHSENRRDMQLSSKSSGFRSSSTSAADPDLHPSSLDLRFSPSSWDGAQRSAHSLSSLFDAAALCGLSPRKKM